MAVSGGVDDFIHPDGNILMADLECRCGGKTERTSVGHLFLPAGGEFFMAVLLFLISMVFVFAVLALFAVGAGVCDDTNIFSNFEDGSVSQHSVPDMADNCRISELRCLVAESVETCGDAAYERMACAIT